MIHYLWARNRSVLFEHLFNGTDLTSQMMEGGKSKKVFYPCFRPVETDDFSSLSDITRFVADTFVRRSNSLSFSLWPSHHWLHFSSFYLNFDRYYSRSKNLRPGISGTVRVASHIAAAVGTFARIIQSPRHTHNSGCIFQIFCNMFLLN